jgi:hypothetical protein
LKSFTMKASVVNKAQVMIASQGKPRFVVFRKMRGALPARARPSAMNTKCMHGSKESAGDAYKEHEMKCTSRSKPPTKPRSVMPR